MGGLGVFFLGGGGKEKKGMIEKLPGKEEEGRKGSHSGWQQGPRVAGIHGKQYTFC